MRILSLYYGHDSSTCLLEDGQPIAVIEKERSTRRRHDQGGMDLSALLERYGWDRDGIDLVVINPYVREDLDGQPGPDWELKGELYTQRSDFHTPDLRCAAEDRYSRHQIRLLGRAYPCIAVDHHLGHLATGYYTSPYASATVLSADGGGDDRTLAAARAEHGRILDIEYGWGITRDGREMNIGSVWGSVGQHHLGYGRLEAAGKLMGLAPYGSARPELVDALRTAAYTAPYAPLPAPLVLAGHLDAKEPLAQDLAASLQSLTTTAYLAAAERLAAVFGADHLVLSGGCSMNCVANTAVHTAGIFTDTFVPAQPSDCGLALGQALFAWHHVLGEPFAPRTWTPYLGTDAGTPAPGLLEGAVDHLEQGLTVGVCVGRAENGARALGHRSILADPRDPAMTARINDTIKHREGFRPFAPMVLEEDSATYFGAHVPSPYMSYTTTVTSPDLPAITHVDGSTRPQIIARADQGAARTILEAWKRRTGLGVLLNTSLNCQEPIVDTPDHAVATWRRSGLDVLVTPDDLHTK
ncbi:carbamoyltransferase C-terminal domain-containing protein [Glycomyces sp. NPDC047010]|uniref:carbamoyltransferase C-terminal domain-containing protein n=1 Tax=Glycomyces sp. NPDC047010 TaxID=3155023 RepID=UPI0033D9953B